MYKSSHGNIASIHLQNANKNRLLFVIETAVTICVEIVDNQATIALGELRDAVITNRKNIANTRKDLLQETVNFLGTDQFVASSVDSTERSVRLEFRQIS